MLLDQQIPMETAFAGPRKIADRLGGLDPRLIADYAPVDFAALCAQSPAVHRFPGSMAKRIQDLAGEIVETYGGDAAGVVDSGRARMVPRCCGGCGRCRVREQKARIFLALLGKRYGVTPSGWRAAAGDYGRAGTHMSVADVVDQASLDEVRAYKEELKAAKQ